MTASEDSLPQEDRPNIIKTPKFATAAADKPFRLYLMLIIETSVTLVLGGLIPLFIFGM